VVQSTRLGLLAALGLAACSDGVGPAVAQLSLTPDSGSVLVGDSLALGVTMLGIGGDTLHGEAVTFESSAPAIATVSAAGVVRGAARGGVVITATSGAASAQASLDIRWGEKVGPAGGSATMWDGGVTLDVPPGALVDSTTIYVDSAAAPPSDSLAVPGAAFELLPSSLAFSQSASLTVRFRAGAVPASREVSVGMFLDSAQAWRAVQGSVLDLPARAVTAPVPGTGLYGLVAPGPVASVTIVGGSLVVLGTSADYRAELRDSVGTLLSNRPIAWSIGDTTIAKVTSTGVVSGVGFGATPLTATSGGAAGALVISVVVICQCPLPVGSRSAAAALCFCATH
jgi:hypothetical protein